MARKSRSTAANLESFRKASVAAVAHKAQLPKEAQAIATELTKRTAAGQKLNSQQETLKAQLKGVSDQLKAELLAGAKLRTKILKLAEVTWGTGAPELVEFRGAGEA